MGGPRRRSKVYRLVSVQPLTPLMEGPPDPNTEDKKSKKESHDITSRKRLNNLKLMLGVLACPLSPVSAQAEQTTHFSIKDSPIEASSARYIVHQYLAATGCLKPKKTEVKSRYIAGSLKMVYDESTTESGCFVLWQMSPDMWLVDMVVGRCKVVAGSNGGVIWRHMPWLGPHAARGPPRPLRRIIQGLDPKVTARVFENAHCIGEKRIGDDDCFVLKVSMNMGVLNAEVIRHVLYGYFSQRSGLIVYIEDPHLTRVQTLGIDTVYWETTIGSTIEDYREIDGTLIAHQGRTVATVFRFGKGSGNEIRTRMVEKWRIDDVVFDVPGLSIDCFIPPAEILGVSK
ncbi:hypothetical protein J5N97_011117 [Dioscorea zingiberensis]|uniref:DUF620 domain-containing protein n=1 Tax=Dioscorea zingiberensis TaxID=325984 RepID=A0A9D5HP94_9LILI|nr:hypothetical protein J5N97_011117 [Dioscorea zingiberensis]